jgi:cobalt-zinc-cadmium efflux system outer membrane protein
MPFSVVESRPLSGRRLFRASCLAVFSVGLFLSAAQPLLAQTSNAVTDQPAPLTIENAIRRALAASPKMQAAQFGIEAAAGTQRQAELRPNPEASVGIENFANVGGLNGVAVTETTVGVSQLIELGGKRDARRAVAGAGRASAETDVRVARLDLRRDVTVAYANALAAQQQLAIAKELEAAARQVLGDVTRRVNAARDPLFQRSKAEVASATSAIARQNAESALSAALEMLGRYWGVPTVNESLSEEGFLPPGPPLSLASYEERLKTAPDLERYRKAITTREAELQLARANAVPDLTANAGVRHFGGTSAVALVAGLSIPIPIFNQNQGEISRAGSDVKRAAQDLRQAELERTQQLISYRSQWNSAWVEANAIRDRSLPEAEKAFSLALDGYHRGAFAYLEVLDAQRTLFDQRIKFNDALARLRAARAETERLAPADNTGGTP